MSTNETQNRTDATNSMGVESRVVQSGKMKDLLQNADQTERRCSNPIWIAFFWIHFFAMCGLIVYALTDEETHEAAGGVLDFFTDFLLGDKTGQRIVGAMLGSAFVGGVWSFIWVRMLKCFEDKSIKVSLVLYHLLVAGMVVLAVIWSLDYIVYVYIAQLVFTDFLLYLQRHNFPFSESLLRVGLGAIVANTKAQCFAYMFMPFQIILSIFWTIGGAFCIVIYPDNWYIIIVGFMASYNWVGYFFHFIVHTFVTVLSGFWLMGLSDGYGKASQSCKMAFTTSMGPIALASFIMAILAFIRTCLSLSIRIASCCLCYRCMWGACCGWLERIIARFNEYVLAYVALNNCEFGEGSRQTVALFNKTGMYIVINEVAWDVCLTVGNLLGYCIGGGVGLVAHDLAFGDEFDMTDDAGLTFVLFIMYGFIGGAATGVGLVPLRSALATVFVVWAEEKESFAKGQPEYYLDLEKSVDQCPQVKEALKEFMGDNAPSGNSNNEKTV